MTNILRTEEHLLVAATDPGCPRCGSTLRTTTVGELAIVVRDDD